MHIKSLYLLIYCAEESKLRRPIFVRQASAGLVTIFFLRSSGELYVELKIIGLARIFLVSFDC